MRERSTWNRDEVQKKVAGLSKKADPYTMNQDHPQPAADKYVTGDPSTFAEDVHTPNTWDVEYKGDEVKRDEIGMADYRPDTFNHAEKTAAQRETLYKKSKLCVAVARLMLAGQKTASMKVIEDQAFALMHMPDEALISTHKRLANEQQGEDEGDDEGQEKQAQAQDEKKEAEGQQEQQAKQAQQDEKKDEGQQDQGKQAQQTQDDKGQQQDKQAKDEGGDQNAKANKNWPTKEASLLVGQVVASLQSGNFKVAQEQIQQLVQQQQASGMDQQQLANQIQQMIQQAMGQQQQVPPAQQAQQQAPVQQQQVQVSDEQVLDQMLAQDSCGPMAEVDIQMDPAQMDVMAGELGPEDEALRTLFAQDDEAKDQGQEQAKQANIRTASNRTVGTRPSAGVAKLGGSAASNGAPDLSSLWPSAPDVRDVFGM